MKKEYRVEFHVTVDAETPIQAENMAVDYINGGDNPLIADRVVSIRKQKQ